MQKYMNEYKLDYNIFYIKIPKSNVLRFIATFPRALQYFLY
jgi:hypothetical protein